MTVLSLVVAGLAIPWLVASLRSVRASRWNEAAFYSMVSALNVVIAMLLNWGRGGL